MAKKDPKPKRKGPGRPPLSPEEKALAKEKARIRRNERDRKRREMEKFLKTGLSKETIIDPEYNAEQDAVYFDQQDEIEGKKPKGGARQGAGRPKGRKMIYSYGSVKKMEELGFDPLEKLTELYYEILETMEATYIDKNGVEQKCVKVGSLAHATMLGHLKGISDSLTKYSYRAVPEKREIDVNAATPTIINLTDMVGGDDNMKTIEGDTDNG